MAEKTKAPKGAKSAKPRTRRAGAARAASPDAETVHCGWCEKDVPKASNHATMIGVAHKPYEGDS